MKKYLLLIIFIGLGTISYSQFKIEAAGGYGGLGSIKGNSTGVASFTTSLFVDTKFGFSPHVAYRFSFFYARKFEALIASNSRSRYYPFHKGFSLKAVINQPLGNAIYLEEGVGPLLLNDRTFSDTDEWAIGVAFHALAGIDLRDKSLSGFKIGVGSEVGTTFNVTTPQFFSVQFQTAYYF